MGWVQLMQQAAHLAVGVIVCLLEPELEHPNILCDAGTDVLQSGRDVRRAGVPDNSSWKRDVHVHCNGGERHGTGVAFMSCSVATENNTHAWKATRWMTCMHSARLTQLARARRSAQDYRRMYRRPSVYYHGILSPSSKPALGDGGSLR